jgi:hypothetical protein
MATATSPGSKASQGVVEFGRTMRLDTHYRNSGFRRI